MLAPDGTAARPKEPSSKVTSTSTVGLPRESRISLALTSTIVVNIKFPFSSPCEFRLITIFERLTRLVVFVKG